MQKSDLVGLVLMGFGNIAAIYSATCSSYFSTYKFSRKDGDSEDRKIAIIAGIYGFVLTTAMIFGIYLIYNTPMVLILLMGINLLLFGLYYDVITGKIGLWDWFMENFVIEDPTKGIQFKQKTHASDSGEVIQAI